MFCSLSKYLLFSDLFWTPAAQAEIRVWTVNNRAGGIFFSTQWCTGVESSMGVFKYNPTICQSVAQSAVCHAVSPNVVINHQFNSRFLADSSSYKIRNGIGLKDQVLYFVISNTLVTFHQFATFFKDELKTSNALYLDGSISTAYIPQLQRHTRIHRNLGPILAYIDDQGCKL